MNGSRVATFSPLSLRVSPGGAFVGGLPGDYRDGIFSGGLHN